MHGLEANRNGLHVSYDLEPPEPSKQEIPYPILYNNQINARALIGQSAMIYCAGKPMENSCVLRIII